MWAKHDLWRCAEADLTHIDGISVATAQTILTEVGLDLAAFPSERHFGCWLRRALRTAVYGCRLAQVAYRMLRWGQHFLDIGKKAYEPRFRHEHFAGMKRAAESQGYELVPQTRPMCDRKLRAYPAFVGLRSWCFRAAGSASFRRGSFGVETRRFRYD